MDKFVNKKTGIAAVIVAVIVIAAIVISTSFTQALTLDEAKEIAKGYVPATATFVTSEEEQNKYEVMFRDDSNSESFEVEVSKNTKKVKKVESQLDNDMGSEKVELKEADVEKIIKEKFTGVTSVSVTLKKDSGLYEYEADFKSNYFYGDAEVHPVSGAILESTVKYGTAVTIPADGKDDSSQSGEFISYGEVEKAVIKAAGGGFIKDIDLEEKKGNYYYEVELIKDGVEYDYIVDAKTGKITLENEHDAYFDYGDESDESTSSANSGNNGSQNSSNGNSQGNGNSSSGESGRISFEKAKSIVLAKIPSATITKLKLEKDDGIYVYEGEAILGDYEYEFEINASSGVIIDWDKERIDDDDDDDDDDWDDDDDDWDDDDWDD